MKMILAVFILIGTLNLSYASEMCGKVVTLYYKAYLETPEFNGIFMGLSGQGGGIHKIPNSAVPLAAVAKAQGLEVCYTVKLDEEGRVYIDELKLK